VTRWAKKNNAMIPVYRYCNRSVEFSRHSRSQII